jgi:excisionase family DNA binding protein
MTTNTISHSQPFRRVLSVLEFSKSYGIGRTRTYQELRCGRLRAYKAGKRTLIATEDADAWLRSLPSKSARR